MKSQEEKKMTVGWLLADTIRDDISPFMRGGGASLLIENLAKRIDRQMRIECDLAVRQSKLEAKGWSFMEAIGGTKVAWNKNFGTRTALELDNLYSEIESEQQAV